MTVTAATTAQAYWYLTRSTGVVSLLLLTAIVILGILGPLRASSDRWPRFTVSRLHRDLSLLVLILLAIHIVTTVLDGFAPIGLLDAVIPLHSSYRPLWLGFGALAFDLLLALTVTSLLRRRLGYERWRSIHWLAYASWPIAVLHGLGTGSDTKQSWLLWLTAACVAATTVAVLMRVARAGEAAPQVRSTATVLAAATPIGLAIFALAGPLQSGWARRAGTPPALLGAAHPARSAAATAALHSFSAQLRGRERRSPAAGGTIVDLDLDLRGSASGVLRVRLAGQPVAGGGLSLVGSQVDLSTRGSVLSGSVTALNGPDIVARVRSSDGVALDLNANLIIDEGTGAVSGRLRAITARA